LKTSSPKEFDEAFEIDSDEEAELADEISAGESEEEEKYEEDSFEDDTQTTPAQQEEEEEEERVQMSEEYMEEYIEEVLKESGYLDGERWDPAQGEPLPVEMFLKVERTRPRVSDEQHIYNKLLFDAIGEALMKLLVPVEDSSPAWLIKRSRLEQLRGNPSAAKIKQTVKEKMLAWNDQKCGDDLGEIDAMLAAEMKEETANWMTCEEEESFLKFEISDNIFNDMIEDTINALQPGLPE